MGLFLGDVGDLRPRLNLLNPFLENSYLSMVQKSGARKPPGMHNKLFFFLHCRTSARHGRSTTGIRMRWKSNFPGRKKPTKNKTNQKTSNNHTQAKAPGQADQPGKFAN